MNHSNNYFFFFLMEVNLFISVANTLWFYIGILDVIVFLSNIVKNSFYSGEVCNSSSQRNKGFWALDGIELKERMSWLGYGQDVLPSVGRGREETVFYLLCTRSFVILFHLVLSVYL